MLQFATFAMIFPFQGTRHTFEGWVQVGDKHIIIVKLYMGYKGNLILICFLDIKIHHNSKLS